MTVAITPDQAAYDPLAEVVELARRQTVEKRANGFVEAAKIRLASYGLTHVLILPDWDIGTICTDGKRIRYNPAFIACLDEPQAIALVFHELQHVVVQ